MISYWIPNFGKHLITLNLNRRQLRWIIFVRTKKTLNGGQSFSFIWLKMSCCIDTCLFLSQISNTDLVRFTYLLTIFSWYILADFFFNFHGYTCATFLWYTYAIGYGYFTADFSWYISALLTFNLFWNTLTIFLRYLLAFLFWYL